MKPIPTTLHQPNMLQQRALDTANAARGKSAESVGHRAKAAVQTTFADTSTAPANAQGLAASAIARGIDPAQLFASMIADQTPVDAADEEAPAPAAATDDATGETAPATDVAETSAEAEGPETVEPDLTQDLSVAQELAEQLAEQSALELLLQQDDVAS